MSAASAKLTLCATSLITSTNAIQVIKKVLMPGPVFRMSNPLSQSIYTFVTACSKKSPPVNCLLSVAAAMRHLFPIMGTRRCDPSFDESRQNHTSEPEPRRHERYGVRYLALQKSGYLEEVRAEHMSGHKNGTS